MGTVAVPFRKALSTNSTATAFTAQTPSATEPSGTGIFDLLAESVGVGMGTIAPTWLQLLAFGTDGDNDTFDFRLYGWNKVKDLDLWIPQLLLDASIVLGNIAATGLGTGNFIADTYTINDGAADNGPWRSIIDCQEDMVGSVLVHTRGCRYIKFDWDLTGGQEGVSMNCLWRPVE